MDKTNKKYKLLALVLIIMLSLIGCEKESNEPSVVEGKYYITAPYVLKFEDNNTVTIVEYFFEQGGNISSLKTYYAIYSCNEAAITINISDKEYVGVIIENGEHITFENDRLDICDINKCSDKVRNAFGVE